MMQSALGGIWCRNKISKILIIKIILTQLATYSGRGLSASENSSPASLLSFSPDKGSWESMMSSPCSAILHVSQWGEKCDD